MPGKEWLQKYEEIKESLCCKTDLESYFTQKKIGEQGVDVLEIGTIHFPTGTILACDPMIELEETLPYLQKVPAGTYPVKICVITEDERYACVKAEISSKKPVRYELGVVGNEYLEETLEDGEYFGFGVDAGMGCLVDIKTQEEFKRFWENKMEEDENSDPYDDLFCGLLEENAKAHPEYQCQYGDWLNWTVPGTDCNLTMFSSGWGDGVYPCYFGYDEENKVCGVYIRFIDIEKEYTDDEE